MRIFADQLSVYINIKIGIIVSISIRLYFSKHARSYDIGRYTPGSLDLVEIVIDLRLNYEGITLAIARARSQIKRRLNKS